MSDRHIEKFYDDILCKDVKTLTEILATITSSYRLLVGAAEEFNRIALVHRHEAEEAIERADDLGDIIDDVEEKLKKLMKLYLQELECKIDYQEQSNYKSSMINDSTLIPKALLEDLKNK
jgi:hypothetical protein